MANKKKFGENNEPQQNRHSSSNLSPNSASRGSVYMFYWLMFFIFGVVAGVLSYPLGTPAWPAITLIAGFAGAYSFKVIPEWERVVVVRLGKFHKVAGPGLVVCVPFIDHVSIHVDHRIMTSSFSAEAALTADLVPVDVDAVLFWVVWDAEQACMEVENYPNAVLCSAQTALRDAIGLLTLGDISMRRKEIDHDLGELLSKKCEAWGITVLSVEIRDIMVPEKLQDALSKEAQAEREKNARIILAEIEKDISEMYVEAAEVYDKNDKAMQLRAMNLAYESAKDGKGTLLVPTSLADGFNISPKNE